MILVILHRSLMYSDTVTTKVMVNRDTAVGLCKIGIIITQSVFLLCLQYGGNVNGPVTKLLMLNASDLEKFASEMFDLQLLISPSENKRAKPHFGLTLK